MSHLSAMMKRRAPKWWARGWPLDFQAKHLVVLPGGCGAQSWPHGTSVSQWQVDAPLVRDRRWCMPSHVSMDEINLIWALDQLPSVSCKCVPNWATWSKCIIVFVWLGTNMQYLVLKKPMVWQSILCCGGGPWLLALTLQVPLWPSRGLRSHIGRPSPRGRPTCNLV